MWQSMKKINEIFYSLQGEGFHTGTPAVFIRFSGCNLKCSFCDTLHEEGKKMSNEEIVNEVLRYPARMVVLTGGEPSLQIDAPLIDSLHRAGKYITVETNGTHPLPAHIDWITCSPKEEHRVVLTKIDEIKYVYRGEKELNRYEQLPATHYFLQPCSGANIPETIDFIMKHPKWRLSLQTHKLVGIQ